ncbi:hypothetical protein CcarbDRAFT_0478 [Clostridium carboxidivorans P7]|uniref:Uncharacterized protein n=1 Tax=Clostridium carboxidivorans P7 TaxID=536227 RepID=C6PNW1_9CLOT|nr:hypothetical protein [Clostridium carboxidivorans]EET89039.1 hypothetical protein CcarbDRAFT_0478 [Clostridium carboxidivorans P7]
MHKNKRKNLNNTALLLGLFLVLTNIVYYFRISRTTYRLLNLADMIAVAFILYVQFKD